MSIQQEREIAALRKQCSGLNSEVSRLLKEIWAMSCEDTRHQREDRIAKEARRQAFDEALRIIRKFRHPIPPHEIAMAVEEERDRG